MILMILRKQPDQALISDHQQSCGYEVDSSKEAEQWSYLMGYMGGR
jgi:hypothetical protein